jgi:hypothetical protein
MSEKNIPAFPYFREIPEKKLDDVMTIFQPGMTLRDWFAGQALTAIDLEMRTAVSGDAINQPIPGVYTKSGSFKFIGKYCYAIADAMIAARSAGEG